MDVRQVDEVVPAPAAAAAKRAGKVPNGSAATRVHRGQPVLFEAGASGG